MNSKPKGCDGCPFKTTGIGFVPFEGDENSLIRICGEAPGAEEVDAGRPFVGRSGQLLRSSLKHAKIDEKKTVVFNSIFCRPPDNNYNLVPPEAIEHCKQNHWPRIEPGSVTFLVGGKALQAFFPKLTSIERWRGSVLPIDQSGAIAIPTLHPSYILRGQRKLLPLLTLDFGNGTNWGKQREQFRVPRIVDSIEFGPTVAIDVEGGSKDQKGSVDLIGITSDGVGVEQIEPTPGGLKRLQSLLNFATTIFAHNAKFDVPDQLERIGIYVNRTHLIDTMIGQALYQSDLEKGLDNSLSITLSGRWTYHKSLYGDYGNRDKDREATVEIWSRIFPLVGVMSSGELYRFYNALDVAGCWRLGVEQQRLLS